MQYFKPALVQYFEPALVQSAHVSKASVQKIEDQLSVQKRKLNFFAIWPCSYARSTHCTRSRASIEGQECLIDTSRGDRYSIRALVHGAHVSKTSLQKNWSSTFWQIFETVFLQSGLAHMYPGLNRHRLVAPMQRLQFTKSAYAVSVKQVLLRGVHMSTRSLQKVKTQLIANSACSSAHTITIQYKPTTIVCNYAVSFIPQFFLGIL